jgi:hypothetical protein
VGGGEVVNASIREELEVERGYVAKEGMWGRVPDWAGGEVWDEDSETVEAVG